MANILYGVAGEGFGHSSRSELTGRYGWPSVRVRLSFGRVHKSLFFKHIRFYYKYLQNPWTDCRSEG